MDFEKGQLEQAALELAGHLKLAAGLAFAAALVEGSLEEPAAAQAVEPLVVGVVHIENY